jgi:hypothetical protein
MMPSMFYMVGIPCLSLFLHELLPRSKCESLLDGPVILLCGAGSVNTAALEKVFCCVSLRERPELVRNRLTAIR